MNAADTILKPETLVLRTKSVVQLMTHCTFYQKKNVRQMYFPNLKKKDKCGIFLYHSSTLNKNKIP